MPKLCRRSFGILVNVSFLLPDITRWGGVWALEWWAEEREGTGRTPLGPGTQMGTEVHCHFAELTEDPWKPWQVALNPSSSVCRPQEVIWV